jgi:hypothetical protein
MDDWKNALFHPSSKSGAGRFAYNLRVPRSPIRPHADTPTPVLCGCGSAALEICGSKLRIRIPQ